MGSRTRSRATTWTEPRCLECGAAADNALRELLDHCHECGCDFTDRPPRSYAELEGLTPMELGVAAARTRKTSSWSWSGVLLLAAIAAAAALAIALSA